MSFFSSKRQDHEAGQQQCPHWHKLTRLYMGGRKLVFEQLAASDGSNNCFSGRSPYFFYFVLSYISKPFTSLFGLLRFCLSYSHGSVPQRRHYGNVFLGKRRVGKQGHDIFLMSIFRPEQWIVTIPSSDQWLATIGNHWKTIATNSFGDQKPS